MNSRFVRAAVLEQAETQLVRARIAESVATKEAMLETDVADASARLADVVVRSLEEGGKVLFFGNGGSAADATHLAAELVGQFKHDRGPLPAMSLTDNGSSVSAIANDYAYEEIFARQVLAFGREGDIAIGLSTSGSSANVAAGLRAAQREGLRTAAITGTPSGPIADEVDVCLCMPTSDTARVQECSLLVGHIVCELVEQAIFRAP